MTKTRAFLAVAALLVLAIAAILLSRDDLPTTGGEDVRTESGACTTQEPLALCPVQ
jgi:hypothetical protein